MASLFALSFLEREKKDLPPLDCRAFLSLDENIAAAGRLSQRWFALPVVGVRLAVRSRRSLLARFPRSCDVLLLPAASSEFAAELLPTLPISPRQE